MKKTLKISLLLFLLLLLLSPVLLLFRSYTTPKAYISDFEVPNSYFLKISDYETYVIDYNPESEKTILFLHGFGGSATNWTYVMPELADTGYRIVAFDLKGFGLSEKDISQDYSHNSQADFVHEVVKELNLQNIILVGHSMGGNISVMYAQKYPERIEKLILVSPAIVEDEIRSLKFLDFPVIRNYTAVFFNLFLANRFDSILKSASYEDIDIPEPVFLNPTAFKNWEYVLIKMGAVAGENVLEKPADEIQFPTLLIWGAEDTWVPLSQGEYLHEEIENSEFLVFENTGHLPMIERVEEFIDSVLYFAT